MTDHDSEHKGWSAVLAVAAVGLTLLVLLLWFVAGSLGRCWFQYGPRSLLLLMIAVAIPCSWLAAEVKEAREQAAIVAAMRRLKWAVGYDYELDASGSFVSSPSPPTPAWLRKLLG